MLCLPLILAAFGTTGAAQWLNYPAPGVPRLPDGKPNLTGPAPKNADGKLDLSGFWDINWQRADRVIVRYAFSSLDRG